MTTSSDDVSVELAVDTDKDGRKRISLTILTAGEVEQSIPPLCWVYAVATKILRNEGLDDKALKEIEVLARSLSEQADA